MTSAKPSKELRESNRSGEKRQESTNRYGRDELASMAVELTGDEMGPIFGWSTYRPQEHIRGRLLQTPDVCLRRPVHGLDLRAFSPYPPIDNSDSENSSEVVQYRWPQSVPSLTSYQPPDHPPPKDSTAPLRNVSTPTNPVGIASQSVKITESTNPPKCPAVRPGRRGKKLCQRCRRHKRGTAAPCEPPTEDPDGPCIPCRKAGVADTCLPRTWPKRSPYNIAATAATTRIESMLPMVNGTQRKIFEEELECRKRLEEEAMKRKNENCAMVAEADLKEPSMETVWNQLEVRHEASQNTFKSLALPEPQETIAEANSERKFRNADVSTESNDISNMLLQRISRFHARYPGFQQRLLEELDSLEQQDLTGNLETEVSTSNQQLQNEDPLELTSWTSLLFAEDGISDQPFLAFVENF